MVKPWTVTSSRLIHQDRWIKLRADSCVRSDGTVIEPFYMTENPDWTCILALTPDRRVVAVREYRHGAGRVVVGLPGGIIDAADASAEVAARRELREETGYVCGQFIGLGAYFVNWAHQSNKMHYFLALDCVESGAQALDATEEIEVVLLDLGAALKPGTFEQSYLLSCLYLARPHLGL